MPRAATLIATTALLILPGLSLHAQTTIKLEKKNGVYMIPCKVNGLALKFIFDTGASDVSLSLTEALFMLKNDYLSESDFTGTERYRVASGEVHEGYTVNLRRIEIGDRVLTNVKASIVKSSEAPLLLGQSALSKLGVFQFDYANNTLVIMNKAGNYSPGFGEVHADSGTHRQSYRVGLLLPFGNDSVLTQVMIGAEQHHHPATLIAAQFYAGASMAFDSLRVLGLNVDVSILDLGDNPSTWNTTFQTSDVKELDLCIGPFHRGAIEQLVRINKHAHIVCPVYQTNKVVLGQPRVSKVTATPFDLIQHTARYIAQHHAKDNIVQLRPDLTADKDSQAQMSRALREALAAQPSRAWDSALVVKPSHRNLGDLPRKLSANRLNVLVVTSEDVEFVTMLMGKLKPLVPKYHILLVGVEGWQHMETSVANDLDQLGFLFAAGSFVDYDNPRVLAFVKAFRERYSNDANAYAFLGFDVTFYYLRALMTWGTDFSERFHQVHTNPLHMGFWMSRTSSENGFRNEYAIMLQQKNKRLTKSP